MEDNAKTRKWGWQPGAWSWRSETHSRNPGLISIGIGWFPRLGVTPSEPSIAWKRNDAAVKSKQDPTKRTNRIAAFGFPATSSVTSNFSIISNPSDRLRVDSVRDLSFFSLVFQIDAPPTGSRQLSIACKPHRRHCADTVSIFRPLIRRCYPK